MTSENSYRRQTFWMWSLSEKVRIWV